MREFMSSIQASLVCLQETKLNVIDQFVVMQCLGPSFDGFTFLPAVGTRGGILLAWDSSVFDVRTVSFYSFSLNAEVAVGSNNAWWITVVYGP